MTLLAMTVPMMKFCSVPFIGTGAGDAGRGSQGILAGEVAWAPVGRRGEKSNFLLQLCWWTSGDSLLESQLRGRRPNRTTS